jgi:hypothetical protein
MERQKSPMNSYVPQSAYKKEASSNKPSYQNNNVNSNY